MPGNPRRKIVRKDRGAVYHCWNRCVRGAYLCGRDPHTGQDFSYRRGWLRIREEQLAALFAIEFGYHAEMSNHLHLVLRTRPDIAHRWSREEVVRRWLTVTRLAKAMGNDLPTPSQQKIQMLLRNKKKIAKLRRRLSSVSWLMGVLCENIARRANREEERKGKFWESRFQCRRCDSEAAILVCGMYVDLNQIRAGEARTPETSRYTSAYDRIQGRRQRSPQQKADGWLCELTLREGPHEDLEGKYRSRSGRRASDQGLLPMKFVDYLQLLEWTGRQLRLGKRGAIPKDLAPILERLAIREDMFVDALVSLDERFGCVLGGPTDLAAAATEMGVRWLKGQRASRQLFR